MKHLEGYLNTPPLWSKEQFGLRQFKMPDFQSVDIPDFEVPTHLRLGHQVERIFLATLEAHPAYYVLAHSVQVKRGNDTIGELDFLVRFRESIYHIELSYKFYLIDPAISEPIHRLIGPNRKDMFWTKLEKTKQKQLPLLHTAECTPHLEALGLKAQDIQQQVCFLGQLFLPLDTVASIRPLNTSCIAGYWVHMEDFEGASFRLSEYYIPHKYEWIHIPHRNVLWQSHFDTLMDVNVRHINNNAPMLWRKLPDGSIEKIFVVWW